MMAVLICTTPRVLPWLRKYPNFALNVTRIFLQEIMFTRPSRKDYVSIVIPLTVLPTKDFGKSQLLVSYA